VAHWRVIQVMRLGEDYVSSTTRDHVYVGAGGPAKRSDGGIFGKAIGCSKGQRRMAGCSRTSALLEAMPL